MEITEVTKLYSIFQDKKWMDKAGNEIVFTNFCKLLSNLNENQRQLVFELAERYTWITFSEYESKLIALLESIDQSKIDGLKKLILFPVMRPEDEGRTKSGHAVLYMLRAIKPLLSKYRKIEFQEIESFDKLKDDKFEMRDHDCLLLLDDYLGSGETISSTITEILKNRNIEPKHITVISLASQIDSIHLLDKYGISYHTDLVTKKGISDYYQTPDLEEKIKIMEEIEKLIPGNHFRFGYNESEALITLMRTPDNTFPIFWKEHKKNNELFEAPFSRY